MDENEAPQPMSMFAGLKRRMGATVFFIIFYFIFLVIWLWFFADGTNPWLLSLGIEINYWRNWSIFILGFLITVGIIVAIWMTYKPQFMPQRRKED